MEEQIYQIDDILEKVIFYAHAEDMNEQIQRFDCAKLITDICGEYQTNNQFVSVTLSLTPYPLTGYPLALSLALRNIIDNGLKYGKRVEIWAEQDAHNIRLFIQDFGSGIAEHELEDVFKPFFRSKDQSKMSIRGSGVGMAIVKRVMDEHNVKISLQNNQQGLLVTLFWSAL